MTLKKLANKRILLISELANKRTCLYINPYTFAPCTEKLANKRTPLYSGVRVIASRILHEICLLIGKLTIRGKKLTLNARLGTKSNLLIEQNCY